MVSCGPSGQVEAAGPPAGAEPSPPAGAEPPPPTGAEPPVPADGSVAPVGSGVVGEEEGVAPPPPQPTVVTSAANASAAVPEQNRVIGNGIVMGPVPQQATRHCTP